MRRKRLIPYIKALESIGFEVLNCRPTGGTHCRVEVTAAGKRRFTIIPNSPSDRRAFLNWKSDIRKLRSQL
jgi:hypothetical protein